MASLVFIIQIGFEKTEEIEPARAVIAVISILENLSFLRILATRFFKYLYHQKYIPYEKILPIKAVYKPLYKDLKPSESIISFNYLTKSFF